MEASSIRMHRRINPFIYLKVIRLGDQPLNEIKSFFKELLKRVEHIELAGEPVHAQSNFVGTLKSLPVRYRFKS